MFIRSKPCSDVVETCGADWSQSGEDLAGQKLVHSQCSNVEGIGGDEDRGHQQRDGNQLARYCCNKEVY